MYVFSSSKTFGWGFTNMIHLMMYGLVYADDNTDVIVKSLDNSSYKRQGKYFIWHTSKSIFLPYRDAADSQFVLPF